MWKCENAPVPEPVPLRRICNPLEKNYQRIANPLEQVELMQICNLHQLIIDNN